MRTLALCQIFQVAADDGSDAFAAAVAECGAPAVLAGGESDEIDVSTYGFTVTDSSSGVLSELEALTGQVRAMEERVGVHLSQVSLVESADVIEHRAPVGAPSANAVASGVPHVSRWCRPVAVPQQVVHLLRVAIWPKCIDRRKNSPAGWT
ncbi:hypothetical protein CYMTET_37184 [Cymbomonas tetramitiformis]|uniref:Uncharacterized protein n=1 Tax=Cymbomonas tetramitiformis TaxID=36881 RepID=A0AAE0F6P9_9CHLO|nr:hypothetical protein CYMTET_37184 [Cymbomonas tetramitiformis]